MFFIKPYTVMPFFVVLTHFLEHISTAADVAQQLAVSYGRMMVWIVTFPDDERGNSFTTVSNVQTQVCIRRTPSPSLL